MYLYKNMVASLYLFITLTFFLPHFLILTHILCSSYIYRLGNLKDSAFFPEKISAFFRSVSVVFPALFRNHFGLYSGIIPEKGRKNTGNRPKQRKLFPEKTESFKF